MTIIAGLMAWLWPYLTGAILAIGGLLGIYFRGKANERAEHERKRLEKQEDIRMAERASPRRQSDRYDRLHDGSA